MNFNQAKKKVLKDIDKAGYGFAVAAWCREEGQPLRLNGESYEEGKLLAYDMYDYTGNRVFGVLKELQDIAEKHGCYWENVNGAETELCY